MDFINNIQNILVQSLQGTLMGPVMVEQSHDSSSNYFRVLSWEVSNGTVIERELPLGWEVSVQPVNFNKSKLVLRITRKKLIDGTYVDGFPVSQLKSIGIESLVPEQFKRYVTTKVTIERLLLSAANVDDIPEPATPSGLVSKIEHEKIDDQSYARKTTTQLIDTNATPMQGEEYGQIVTLTTYHSLVPAGTLATTGYNVISSEVTPNGDGTATKITKMVKGSWPNPVEKETSRDGTNDPPARYRKYLERTRETRKIPTNQIPSVIGLSGDQVAKTYKRETPDRAEETVVTEKLELKLSSSDESIEQKPFVTLRQTMTPGNVPVLPATGEGSSRLVYDGAKKIYENVKQIATPRAGNAGSEKEQKAYVSITRDKRYSTFNNIATSSGSAQIVFNDGNVQVYEITEERSQARTGSAGQERDVRPYVSLLTDKSYTTSGTVSGATGTSRVVYNDGTLQIYEVGNVRATPRYDRSGQEIERKPYVEITTNKRFAPSPTVSATTGSSNVVYNDGQVQVYEVSENSSRPVLGNAGEERRGQPWGYIASAISYTTSGTVGGPGSSKIIYNDGQSIVYEVSRETAQITSGGFVSQRNKTPLYTEEVTTTYGRSATVSGDMSRSRVIYNDGQVQVYENEAISVTAGQTRTYQTVARFAVPAVLKQIQQITFPKRDGTTEIHFVPVIEEGFEGYFNATVIEKFTVGNATATKPIKYFKPAPVSIITPYGSLRVSPTLHSDLSFNLTTGTIDPVYEYIIQRINIPQTDPPQWKGAGEILVGFQSDPFKNGFITREIYVKL